MFIKSLVYVLVLLTAVSCLESKSIQPSTLNKGGGAGGNGATNETNTEGSELASTSASLQLAEPTHDHEDIHSLYTKSDELIDLNGARAREITLSNNLKVILVNAPASSKSAISVAVNVGHEDNPVEHQGLAHYLEHMLFLGTEDFPEVSEYSSFIRSNGGNLNAFTSLNFTNYLFDIQSSAFEEGVHRISRFFVNPLFDENYSEREKNAVENEYRGRYSESYFWRFYRAFFKESSNTRLFAVGNLETFKTLEVQDTKDFFKKHYFAEAMRAVLMGPQDFEELGRLAQTYLSDIKSEPDRPLKQKERKLDIDFNQLPARVLMRPVEGRSSRLSLFVPFTKLHKSEVLLALSSLLNDKGEGSLMEIFVDKNWIKANAEDYQVLDRKSVV